MANHEPPNGCIGPRYRIESFSAWSDELDRVVEELIL
jgi:hypothetical protein